MNAKGAFGWLSTARHDERCSRLGGSCFAERLKRHIKLTAAEETALARLEDGQRKVRRGAVVHRANDNVSELFVLRQGRLMSFVILPDGSRQILRVYFPGDFIGAAVTLYLKAPESLVAITDAILCPFDKSGLRTLLDEHPRIAALMFVLGHTERVALTDRLASLGRSSAKGRIAAFLLDIADRLRLTDEGITDSFDLKLTQEEVGDAIGLTSVHVNRMFRALEAEVLIARSGGRITLLDERKLQQLGHYTNRYKDLDISWLTT